MRTPRHVMVTCDICGLTYSILANCVDDKEIDRSIGPKGWKSWNGKDYCPNCINPYPSGPRLPRLPRLMGSPEAPPLPENPSEYTVTAFIDEWMHLCVRICNVMDATKISKHITESRVMNAKLDSGISKMDELIFGDGREAYLAMLKAAYSEEGSR